LPYVLALADKGWVEALRADVGLQSGLNIHAGEITHNAVAEALGLRYLPVEKVLATCFRTHPAMIPGLNTELPRN
jgi:alanine dehydrogenase